MGDKDWAGRASGDGAHSRASSQTTSVMGQKYKPLLMLVPGHWAQVWGAVMGHGRGAITGTMVEDQDAAGLGNNRWGAELACLPLCPTGAQI